MVPRGGRDQVGRHPGRRESRPREGNSLVVQWLKIPCFYYRGHRFDPWSENQDPTCPALQPKEREKKKDQGGRQKPEREGQRLRKRGNRDLEEERTARHSREMIVK